MVTERALDLLASIIGVTLGFLFMGWTLHFFLALYQTFFGFDGKPPWKSNPRMTVEEEMERWWEFNY
jgi:hypothetical protein